jgi:hypothetical protein
MSKPNIVSPPLADPRRDQRFEHYPNLRGRCKRRVQHFTRALPSTIVGSESRPVIKIAHFVGGG